MEEIASGEDDKTSRNRILSEVRGMLGEASSRAKGHLAPVMTVAAKELSTSLTSRAANKWCSCLCAGEKNRRIKCLLA